MTAPEVQAEAADNGQSGGNFRALEHDELLRAHGGFCARAGLRAP